MLVINAVVDCRMEIAKLVVPAVAGLVAAFSLLAGLVQYRRAQLWRRKEFIGGEVKAFLQEPAVRNALLMVDWYRREIPFDPAIPRASWPAVTREMQVAALEPHTLRPDDRMPVGRATVGFSELEASIRDTYDAFLDGLERLSAFAESGLYREEELLPYLGYWIDDLASDDRRVNADRRWRLAVLGYIEFYRFRGVQRLFHRLGRDIGVGGRLWLSLRDADPELAKKLEEACKGERSREGGKPAPNSGVPDQGVS